MLELQRLSGGETNNQNDLGEPPARKLRKTQGSSWLDSVFDEIADEQASTSSTAPVGASIQLETYLGESTTAREDNPMQYWGVNRIRFSTLAQMSQRYLSAQ